VAWADRWFAVVLAWGGAARTRFSGRGHSAAVGSEYARPRRCPSGPRRFFGRLGDLRFARRVRVACARTTVGLGPRAFPLDPAVAGKGIRPVLRKVWAVLRALGRELLARLVRAARADEGMSTAEYAI